MRCERYEQDLIERAAGGAPSPRLDAHLLECPSCRGRLDEQRRLLEDFDGALLARLGTEPSPELASRVAARVAYGEANEGWKLRALALAAGLGILLLGGWMLRRPSTLGAPDRSTADAASLSPRGARAQPSGPPQVGDVPSELQESSAPVPPVRSRRAAGPARRQEPEVLVPAGQEEALGQFVAGLRRGALPAPPLLASATAPETPLPPPEPIKIPPLVSNPLSDSADSPARSDS